MIHPRRFLASLALAAYCVAGPANAQVSPDQAVRKILETIDEELTEIDRMLLETSKRDSVGKSEATEQLERLMKDTRGSQERVVRGIDQLIEELEKMQSSSQQGGGGSRKPGEQPQRSQDELENQSESTRQDNAPPEGMQNLRPGTDKPQPQNQDGQSERSGENPAQGQNQPGPDRQDGGTERAIRESDRAKWGNLPNYDLHNHLRGGLPEVPEKYRKFLDEYHRKNQRSRANGSGGR